MLDIILLRILKYQEDHTKLIKSIPLATLDDKTKTIIAGFTKYFGMFPEHVKVDLQVFIPRFRSWHSSMDEETFNVYVSIFKNIIPDVDPNTRLGIVNDLYEADTAMRIANLCMQYEDGSLDAPLPDLISSIIDTYKLNVSNGELKWNTTDIGDLLQEDLNNDGLKWRLRSLNECMRPLRPGDFGIIAGRPDKGKTTFLSSEVTFLASQLPPDRNVVWLNNEGLSDRIKKRLYQSALGLSVTELIELNKQGKLRDLYTKAIGRLDRIRIYDIHGMHVGQVESILQQDNPGVILYDMIDNIRGFGNESRLDSQLEAMYQWGRERSVKYNAVGLATSQISADGDGLQFPTLSMLKDSKTGKQGACDFQLMIGASNDVNLDSVRYLSLPKNKLRRDDGRSDPRAEVNFRPIQGRYEDII